MFCNFCGAKLEPGQNACPSCGKTVVTITDSPPPASQQDIVQSKYKGLRGWLLLVLVGLIGGIILRSQEAYLALTLLTSDVLGLYEDPSSDGFIPGFSDLVKLELLGSIILLAANGYLIYLFFKKSKQFPHYFVAYLAAIVLYTVVDFVYLSFLSSPGELGRQVLRDVLAEQEGGLFRVAITAMVWGVYMNSSRRVKATFVEK